MKIGDELEFSESHLEGYRKGYKSYIRRQEEEGKGSKIDLSSRATHLPRYLGWCNPAMCRV